MGGFHRFGVHVRAKIPASNLVFKNTFLDLFEQNGEIFVTDKKNPRFFFRFPYVFLGLKSKEVSIKSKLFLL